MRINISCGTYLRVYLLFVLQRILSFDPLSDPLQNGRNRLTYIQKTNLLGKMEHILLNWTHLLVIEFLMLIRVHEAVGSNPATRTMRSVLIGSEYPTKGTPHFLLSKLGQRRFRRTAADPGCTGALPCDR